ncbi:MAG: metallophosphoesterase [Eubacteriales bacterium]
MALFSIADLHLSFTTEKPMDIYGGWWINHTETIRNNWLQNIGEDDTVLIPGDISWALRLEDAKEDLSWLDALPGKKIAVKGNHDLWWSSISKLSKLSLDINFIQNNFFQYEDYAICGTRGWICPGDKDFTIHDEKIYKREVNRLMLSLNAAKSEGFRKFIAMLHFPPTNENMDKSGFTELLEEYGVEALVYGHLHNKEGFNKGIKGEVNGIKYYLTSCDAIECNPMKLL